MSAKLTQQQVEQYFLDRGSKLLSTYMGRPYPVTFICSKCGSTETWEGFGNLKRQVGNLLCKKCLSLHKDIIRRDKRQQQAKQYFIDKGSELLSEYENCTTRINFRCSKCGNPGTYKDFDALKRDNPKCVCLKCQKQKLASIYKLDQEDVEQWFLDRGSKLLSVYKNSKFKVEFQCSKCGSWGSYSSFGAKERTIRTECLCKECLRKRAVIANKGLNNPMYDPLLTDKERMESRSYTIGSSAWKKEVEKTRKCLLTSIDEPNVQHHIFSWKSYPQYRTSVWNGISISRVYHNMFHKKYGRGGNTLAQFKQFYKDVTGFVFHLFEDNFSNKITKCKVH